MSVDNYLKRKKLIFQNKNIYQALPQPSHPCCLKIVEPLGQGDSQVGSQQKMCRSARKWPLKQECGNDLSPCVESQRHISQEPCSYTRQSTQGPESWRPSILKLP